MEARAALAAEWRRSKIWIARVNRRATWQRHIRERRTTVIQQWTEQGISTDLIAWASQITAAVIATEIVPKRCDGAAVIENVFAGCACIEDCAVNFNQRCSEWLLIVVDATARACRVVTERAVSNY
jgi:hypothetical protein